MKKFTAIVFCLILLMSNFTSKAQCLPATVPYIENFSGVTVNNQLPACWAVSNASTCLTFTGTGGFAAFYWVPAGSSYFYSKALQLNAGVIYSGSLFYSTQNGTGPTWTSLAMLYGTSQSSVGLTPIASMGTVISPGFSALSNTFTVNSTGVYYLAINAQSTGGCCNYYLAFDDLSVTIPCALNSPTLTVGASTNVLCAGQSVVLFASGADTYTWSNGTSGPTATMTASPLITTTFSVSGTHTASGCISTTNILIPVNPSPNVGLLASEYTVCSGNNVLLSAFGANSYSWSTNVLNVNQITISPTVSATYSVMGSNNFGCKDSAYVNISVLPPPLLNAISEQDSICVGQSVNLMVLGAQTYTWTNGTTSFVGSTVQVSPSLTTVYTVTGTDSQGCTNSLTLVQTVVNCVFEQELVGQNGLKVYPNPVYDYFYIEFNAVEEITLSIMDASGRPVMEQTFASKKISLNTETLSQGFYHVKIETQNKTLNYKLIKN